VSEYCSWCPKTWTESIALRLLARIIVFILFLADDATSSSSLPVFNSHVKQILDWLTVWLIDWLIDWLIGLMVVCLFQFPFKYVVYSISVAGKSAGSPSDLWPQVTCFHRGRVVQQWWSALRGFCRRGAAERSRDTTRKQGSWWRHNYVTGTCWRRRLAPGESIYTYKVLFQSLLVNEFSMSTVQLLLPSLLGHWATSFFHRLRSLATLCSSPGDSHCM